MTADSKKTNHPSFFADRFPTMFLVAVTLSALSFPSQTLVGQVDLATALAAVRAVDVEGQGHDEAIEAMKLLNQSKADQIPELLIGMDGANKLALNWIRAAIQSAIKNGGKFPNDEIMSYFKDTTHSELGRLLAFELLAKENASVKTEIIPTLADDPCLPLRRMAIDQLIETAKTSEGAASIGCLGIALDKARDIDQLTTIVTMLDERNVKIDSQRQLGFINEWHLAGPFDNTDSKGFDIAFGPEKALEKIDLESTYEDGKDSQSVKWQKRATVDQAAAVDLNEVLGKIKFATAYAFAEFEAAEDREAEMRIGCINGHKVWVNGELVISNEVYHVGMMPDQYSGTTKLKAGTNTILIKVCQNDQKQPYAQEWSFQLRVCDNTGKAIAPAKKPEAEQN